MNYFTKFFFPEVAKLGYTVALPKCLKVPSHSFYERLRDLGFNLIADQIFPLLTKNAKITTSGESIWYMNILLSREGPYYFGEYDSTPAGGYLKYCLYVESYDSRTRIRSMSTEWSKTSDDYEYLFHLILNMDFFKSEVSSFVDRKKIELGT